MVALSFDILPFKQRIVSPIPAYTFEFSKFECKILFEIYHQVYGEGKHREDTCTHLQSHLMMSVKLPFRIGQELQL